MLKQAHDIAMTAAAMARQDASALTVGAAWWGTWAWIAWGLFQAS